MSSNIKLLLLLFMPIGAAALAIDSFESQWSNLDDSVPFIVFVHVSYSHRSNTMTTHMITKKKSAGQYDIASTTFLRFRYFKSMDE